MTKLETITRRELAQMLGMSTDSVRKAEARIGLKMCRCYWSKRAAIYRKRDAFQILRALGFPV